MITYKESGYKIYSLNGLKIVYGSKTIIGDKTSPEIPTTIVIPELSKIYGCTIVSNHPNHYGKYKINISENKVNAWFEGASAGHSSCFTIIGV